MSDKFGYEEGKQAAIAWNTSPAYQQFNRDLPADEIMALFLPAAYQTTAVQMSQPLPKPYQEWINGFNEEMNEILSKLGGVENV